MKRERCDFAAMGLVVATLAALCPAQEMPRLAPGVLTVIPATPEEEETVTGPRALHELKSASPDWTPHYSPDSETLRSLADAATLRRAVWQLQFSFKPVRMLSLTPADGPTRRIWYLLYNVKNTGGYVASIPEKDEFGNDIFVTAHGSRTLRFFPLFVLRAHDQQKSYADQLLPGVVPRIHEIEIRDPSVVLHDSVSITRVPIQVSTETEDRSVWGVATWLGVDRETDFFSVFVHGLSNAYQWADGDQQQPLLTFKTLQLNFWRPGDAVHENSREFRYGLPAVPRDATFQQYLELYGLSQPLNYQWVFLP